MVSAVKKMVGLEDPAAAESELKMFEDQCALSKKQRMMGFAGCFAAGFLISCLSMMMIAKPTSFSLLYSLGNVVSFLSTGFLVGFKRQLKAACARKRVIATIIFFAAIIGTITAAVTLGNIALCIVLIVIQFCALVWYTASYIPFAQEAIKKAVMGVCCRGGGGAAA